LPSGVRDVVRFRGDGKRDDLIRRVKALDIDVREALLVEREKLNRHGIEPDTICEVLDVRYEVCVHALAGTGMIVLLVHDGADGSIVILDVTDQAPHRQARCAEACQALGLVAPAVEARKEPT
jgi:hypothetical protein